MRRNRLTWFGLIVVLITGLGLLCVSIARGPDRNLVFERVIDSRVNVATLDQAVERVINWPQWHHNMSRVKAIDLRGQEYALTDQTVMTGSLIKFEIMPPKKEWKKFELLAEVRSYAPREKIQLRVLKDSTGRLTSLFSTLEWTVRFEPLPGGGTRIHGRVDARTSHWRSRLFGTLTPRVLLHQVFYPNLLALAELEKPLSLNPTPQAFQ